MIPRQVHQIAKRTREKVEKLDKRLYLNMEHGPCGVASLLLAEALLEKGYAASVVSGYYLDSAGQVLGHHVWVEYEEYIIDITANQFGVKTQVPVAIIGTSGMRS
jgi:nanoRNase/pAp phosphatase (c-di-AMP/oligoRNAs hydrolase)